MPAGTTATSREHGREAVKPLIETGEGDMQMFVSLLAGTAGGRKRQDDGRPRG
jgi:hypothetical protein